jgi:flagellar protein FlbD
MIAVTRLDGTPMILNIDLIEYIEQTPDTLISLADGAKLVVRETPAQIVERVIEFKRTVARPEFPREASKVLAADPAAWTEQQR